MRTIRSSWVEVGGVAVGAVLLALCGLALSQEIVNDPGKGKGYKRPTPEQRQAMYAVDKVRNGSRVAAQSMMAAPPAKFDCVEMGWAPPIRDQGSCGSCYLVATADQATCTWIKAGHGKNDDTFKISDQFGMDCHDFGGCNGGWGVEVAEWMVKNGFPAEYYKDSSGWQVSDYPAYQARSMACREKAGAKRWKPAGWGFCSGSSGKQATVLEIKTSLMNYGVVNIAFSAVSAYGNAGTNVIKITSKSVDHETTLVGWDDSKSAWKTRGNWGTGLGDKGYVWMHYDSYLEDPFWMTAHALPPPPPDPVPDPPGPGPAPDTILTINKFLNPGSYVLVPSGTAIVPPGFELAPIGTSAKLKAIEDILRKVNAPPKVMPLTKDSETEEPEVVKVAPPKAAPIPMAETIKLNQPKVFFHPDSEKRDPKNGKILKKAG